MDPQVLNGRLCAHDPLTAIYSMQLPRPPADSNPPPPGERSDIPRCVSATRVRSRRIRGSEAATRTLSVHFVGEPRPSAFESRRRRPRWCRSELCQRFLRPVTGSRRCVALRTGSVASIRDRAAAFRGTALPFRRRATGFRRGQSHSDGRRGDSGRRRPTFAARRRLYEPCRRRSLASFEEGQLEGT
jgi:hypothetical protein